MYNRLYTNVPCGNRAEDCHSRDVGVTTAPLVINTVVRSLCPLAKVKVTTSYDQALGSAQREPTRHS